PGEGESTEEESSLHLSSSIDEPGRGSGRSATRDPVRWTVVCALPHTVIDPNKNFGLCQHKSRCQFGAFKLNSHRIRTGSAWGSECGAALAWSGSGVRRRGVGAPQQGCSRGVG